MPSLADSNLLPGYNMTRKEPRPMEPPVHNPPPQTPYWLMKSPFASTPIPPLVVSVDNTRNFYKEGVPQYRIIPAQS